jgi:hypothetical protein
MKKITAPLRLAENDKQAPEKKTFNLTDSAWR